MGSTENKNKKNSLVSKLAKTVIIAGAGIGAYIISGNAMDRYDQLKEKEEMLNQLYNPQACELVQKTADIEDIILNYIQNNGYNVSEEKVKTFKEEQKIVLKEGKNSGKINFKDYQAGLDYLENMLEDSRIEISSNVNPNFRETGYQGTNDDRTYSLGNNNVNIKKNSENVEITIKAFDEEFSYTTNDKNFDSVVSNVLNTFVMANEIYKDIVGNNKYVVCKNNEGNLTTLTGQGYQEIHEILGSLLPKDNNRGPLNALTNQTSDLYKGEQ